LKKNKNILKYLSSTKNYKTNYNGQGKIIAFTDSDFAGDIKDKKSTSGYIILISNNPIYCISKKQSVVATSTTEAEYISTSQCIKKLLWIRNILFELIIFNKPITSFIDNNSCKISMENGDLNPKLKQISIKYHFNADNIRKNINELKHKKFKNLVETLTKVVNGNKMKSFINITFNN